jgi:2-dehydro-3-deoxyphosphooctonate aldolase (KDO 8-P synthase)
MSNAPDRSITLGNVTFANDKPLSLIAGPCQLESRDHAFMMAGALKEMSEKLGIGLVYKTSYDKANRTSIGGKRGLGLEMSLEIFADIKKAFGLPVLTDVHTEEQCRVVGAVVDILQIPAFLSRQRHHRPRNSRQPRQPDGRGRCGARRRQLRPRRGSVGRLDRRA